MSTHNKQMYMYMYTNVHVTVNANLQYRIDPVMACHRTSWQTRALSGSLGPAQNTKQCTVCTRILRDLCVCNITPVGFLAVLPQTHKLVEQIAPPETGRHMVDGGDYAAKPLSSSLLQVKPLQQRPRPDYSRLKASEGVWALYNNVGTQDDRIFM